jgi:hypothetical protein
MADAATAIATEAELESQQLILEEEKREAKRSDGKWPGAGGDGEAAQLDEDVDQLLAQPSAGAKPPPTPLPSKTFAVLACVLISDAMSGSVIFPFVGFMVRALLCRSPAACTSVFFLLLSGASSARVDVGEYSRSAASARAGQRI